MLDNLFNILLLVNNIILKEDSWKFIKIYRNRINIKFW